MPPGFSSDFKELVRSQTDLVALAAETVALTPQRGGAEYVGLCPFHDDHNPSLRIYPDRQTYRCWVCDAGGDCFSWVQEIEKVGFREALETLARAARLEIPKQMARGSQSTTNEKQRLQDILAWAEREFHQCFLTAPAAQAARDYIASRGYDRQCVEKFRIGYHPDDWEWLLGRAGRLYRPEELAAVGLAGKRRSGIGFHDYYVNRVLFPIRDERGRPVSFGGRVLPGQPNSDQMKYWNGPDTPVFNKSSLLYGFDLARDAVRSTKTAAVVEGYTDCIALHRGGLTNAVGTLGTSLTEQHVRLLKRFAQRVVLVYDGDDAGKNAAERSLAKFLTEDVDLRVLTIPNKMDPAEYLDAEGADAFRELIAQAPEAFEYKLQTTIARYGLESIDARDRVAGEMLELLAQQSGRTNQPRADAVLGRLSVRLGIDERALRARLKDVRSRLGGRRVTRVDEAASKPAVFAPELTKDLRVECELIEIVFTDPRLFEKIRDVVDPNDFRDPHLRGVYETCLALDREGKTTSPERVIGLLEDTDLKRVAVWLEDQARRKHVAERLKEEPAIASPDSMPLFLKQLLDTFTWRHEQQTHELRKSEYGREHAATEGLNAEKKAMLRHATAHHQKRATKSREFQ